MTINDLLTYVRVGDPQLSPDGREVLYVRTTTDPATFKRNADIYKTSSGRGERNRQRGDGGDKSREHAALASRREGLAYHLLARRRTAGLHASGRRNVRKLTNISGGVQPPLVVSPDGSLVAFVADVYPDCADDACNKARRAAADADPVKVHVLTRLLFRHWDEWREGIRHHVFVVPTNETTPGRGS